LSELAKSALDLGVGRASLDAENLVDALRSTPRIS
jgi:hypothetical protein